MLVDEHIVLTKPANAKKGGSLRRAAWIRHAVSAALWNIRRRIMIDTSEDIFQVYDFPDRVEINIHATFDTSPVSAAWVDKNARIRDLRERRKKEKEAQNAGE